MTKERSLLLLFFLISTAVCYGQTSWLDRPLDRNWNTGNGIVPNAPRTLAPIDTRCRDQIRNPESLADRAVTRAGWSLFGAAQVFGPVTIVNAMAGTDGMCRPTQHNTFVFVGSNFAGTLAPEPMDARSDGVLVQAVLSSPTEIFAEYARYTSRDALCCPSQQSNVSFTIGTGPRGVVRATNLETSAVCQPGGPIETQDNVVSGTVTYRQRSALPPTAVLTVKIVDVSRADASATVVTEQRIEIAGKQVPISFDMAYDRSKILDRNRYAVQAEIRDGGRLLFITDTSYPVITQGSPRNVEITLVPVGGGGGAGRSNVIRGTVSYQQRSALPANAEITVRLLDAEDLTDTPVAQTTFTAGTRQVPIPFELTYEPRDIDRQRNYELYAEIKASGKVLFRTEAGKAVNLRGGQPTDNALMLVAEAGAGTGTEAPATVTGKTLSLSKYGTGSLRIGNATRLLIRGTANVSTDGSVQISVASIEGTIRFTGKLTYFDDTTLRIIVESSGNATASGEIEIKYSGRSLRSMAGSNLKLDGQDVTLTF
jgi:uncharacterized lipoprotein YbaY